MYNGEKLLQFADGNGQKLDVLDVNGQIYVPLEALIRELGGEFQYLPEGNFISFSLPVAVVEPVLPAPAPVAAEPEPTQAPVVAVAEPEPTQAPAPAPAASALPSPAGRWHADLANTTADLNLLDDGTAALTIMSLPFGGTWELNGDTFIFHQNGQVFEGTYDGEKIIMDFSIYHLELTRK